MVHRPATEFVRQLIVFEKHERKMELEEIFQGILLKVVLFVNMGKLGPLDLVCCIQRLLISSESTFSCNSV